jgi:hypothetical protein
MEKPEVVKATETGAAATSDRRTFMRAAVGGLAAATSLVPAALGESRRVPGQASEGSELQTPPGLNPNAMLDSRFRITYQNSIPEGMKVITQHFAALCRRDVHALADTLHYPFGIYEGTEPVVVQSADEFVSKAPPSLNLTGNPERFTDHDGYIKPGSYDILDSIEVFNSDPVSANFSLNYSRYGSDGAKLLKCEGVYIVTNNDGKWAVQLMSTIFTPAAMANVTYPDTVEFAKRIRMTHDLAFEVADNDEVWKPVSQYGPQASIRQDTIRIYMAGGKAGKSMDAFATKGVKSRLELSETTPESIEKRHTDFVSYRDMFKRTGAGNWGFTYGVLPYTRVIHATVNKAHLYSGATRYNVFGEESSTAPDIIVMTYKKGRWGWSGMLGHTTGHDCGNDAHT